MASQNTPPSDVTSIAIDFIKRVAEESKLWNQQAHDAWHALVDLGARDLPNQDEVAIAQNIYPKFGSLKLTLKSKGISLGQFCEFAQIGDKASSSKELHRLMLAPGKDPKEQRVRKNASKYRWLIEAMAEVLDVDRSTLANELLLGASIHPVNADFRREVIGIQNILQAIVDKVDREFSLSVTFKETANLKAAHAKDGGNCRWPHGDADWRAMFVPIDEDPIENADQQIIDTEGSKNNINSITIQRERELTQDVRFAYWCRTPNNFQKKHLLAGQESGCLMDDNFFHIPHAYLGYGEGLFFQMNYLHVDALSNKRFEHFTHEEIYAAKNRLVKDSVEVFEKYGFRPSDDWDPIEEKPKGQISSLPFATANYHAWVIIYPAPVTNRLLPMLMIPCEEGGPFLTPLDAISLEVLRNNYWVHPNGEVEEFIEGLKRMLGFDTANEDSILDGLRRTAPWLSKNPILKKRAEMEKMRKYLTNLYRN